MKKLVFLSFLLFSISVSAQKFQISGKLQSEEAGSPLASATVFVEQVQDSTLVAYTISNEEGTFSIEGATSSDTLRLVANFAGYIPLVRVISLERPHTQMGTLEMKVATNELGEVVVVSERAPVTVKTDTLEFNAGSFNTRQNANLEEVLEKLPGVEVDSEGNITVNGKPVSRILVNGEEFFGEDPKIATKNLPKEIIDKIQVVNTKTKTEEFTGKAGDPDNKTINVTIKEDKNKGYFARATAGGGTDERYELSGIGNYFKDDMRLSFLASSNNINSVGFSFDEVFDMMGGRARRISRYSDGRFAINGIGFGAGGGITKSENAGVNFTDKWGEQYELSANYFFGRNDTETRTLRERENFLPNGTYYTNSSSEGNLVNDSHRANISFEVEFDTLTKLSVRPSFTLNKGFSRRSSSFENLNESRELTNASTTLSNEELNSSSFNNSINFIKRFGSRGAYIQAELRNENEHQENDNLFFSEVITYQEGPQEVTGQNQIINEVNDADKYHLGLNQRSVLAEDLFLDISYDFNTSFSENTREVYDFDADTDQYSEFNETLSNDFEIKSLQHIPNAGISYEGSKLRAGFDIGLLNTSLETQEAVEGTQFDRTFNNLFLSSHIRYQVKKGASMNMHYSTSSEIPQIRHMQPVEDITDPLNVVVGNPELKPTYRHRINFNFFNFDFATRSGYSLYAGGDYAQDEVVPFTVVNEDLFSTTTYINVDGSASAYMGASYNKRIKKDKNEYSYRLGGNVNYRREIGFSNEIRYNADRFSLRPSITLGYNYNDQIEINPRYEAGYHVAQYDINQDREEEYLNHTVGLEATSYWPGNLVFGNDISYNYFGNVSPGFDSNSLLWNMSLGYEFLDDDATVKVKVYDLLNENISTSRITGQNFVQDTQELVLEQYFMLSFTYKFSKFGGKDPNRNGGSIRF